MAGSISVGELNLLFTTNLKPLIKGFDQARSAMGSFKNDADKIRAAIATPEQMHDQRVARSRELFDQQKISLKELGLYYKWSVDQMEADMDRLAMSSKKNMEALNKGSNRMSFAIGQAMTGVEDFVTVVGTTGLGGGLRAASNNFAQAGRIAIGEFAGPLIGIGSIILAVALPALIKWVKGAKDAKEVAREAAVAVKELDRAMSMREAAENRGFDATISARSISRMEDPVAIKDQLETIKDEQQKVDAEIQRSQDDINKRSGLLMQQIFTEKVDADLQGIVDYYRKNFGIEAAKDIRNKLLGPRSAFLQAIRDGVAPMDAFKDLQESFSGLDRDIAAGANFVAVGELSGSINALGSDYAEIDKFVDKIRNNQDLMANLSAEQQQRVKEIALLEDQIAKAKEMQRQADLAENEQDVRSLMAKEKEKLLLEGLTQAEKSIYQIQNDRVALLEAAAGLGADELDNARDLADAQLRARAARIQGDLDDLRNGKKKQEEQQRVITFSQGRGKSSGEVLASAVNQIAKLSVNNEEKQREQQRDEREEAMLEELELIRRLQEGQKPVELAPVP
jgi:hypothetical protein